MSWLGCGLPTSLCSGESNRPLTPIHVKKYRDTPPISMAYFCKCMPCLWQNVVYTPPICITIRLPFVSRYFCGSIRVRGRWDTPNLLHAICIERWRENTISIPIRPLQAEILTKECWDWGWGSRSDPHLRPSPRKPCCSFRADFWEGDATKHFSVKKGVFSEKGGGNSVNGWFGKDFYRKGNSVKRSGRFSEPPDSEN